MSDEFSKAAWNAQIRELVKDMRGVTHVTLRCNADYADLTERVLAMQEEQTAHRAKVDASVEAMKAEIGRLRSDIADIMETVQACRDAYKEIHKRKGYG